jgi:hypothetical protein
MLRDKARKILLQQYLPIAEVAEADPPPRVEVGAVVMPHKLPNEHDRAQG